MALTSFPPLPHYGATTGDEVSFVIGIFLAVVIYAVVILIANSYEADKKNRPR